MYGVVFSGMKYNTFKKKMNNNNEDTQNIFWNSSCNYKKYLQLNREGFRSMCPSFAHAPVFEIVSILC